MYLEDLWSYGILFIGKSCHAPPPPNSKKHQTFTPLHKICIWTQIRKIKRKLNFNQSESRIKDLRLIFLICVQTQILCKGAIHLHYISRMHIAFNLLIQTSQLAKTLDFMVDTPWVNEKWRQIYLLCILFPAQKEYSMLKIMWQPGVDRQLVCVCGREEEFERLRIMETKMEGWRRWT